MLEPPLPRLRKIQSSYFDRQLSPRAKFLIWLFGTVLFLASLIFLGLGIRRNWAAISSTRISDPLWLRASFVIYGVSHFTTGAAWPLALRSLGERINTADGLKIGLLAQVGKYLPGNIAHYFGRAALAKSQGVRVRSTGISTALELLSTILAALTLSPWVLLSDRYGLLPYFMPPSAVAVTLAPLAIVALLLFFSMRTKSLRFFAYTSVSLTVSLLLSGTSAYALLIAIGAPAAPWTLVVGCFGFAWIAGFLIPGAPAGFGVREFILVTLIGPYVGAGTAFACAILHRLVTASVDLLAGLIGYVWFASGRRSKT